jgi:hypothetical protein
MAPLVSTIDIARPQEEVFADVTDPTKLSAVGNGSRSQS